MTIKTEEESWFDCPNCLTVHNTADNLQEHLKKCQVYAHSNGSIDEQYLESLLDSKVKEDENSGDEIKPTRRRKSKRKQKVTNNSRKKVKTKARSSRKKVNYSCDNCSSFFSTQEELETHLQIHKGEKDIKFKCEKCDKVLPTGSTLKHHMRIAHNVETRHKMSCKICRIKFHSRLELSKHYKWHGKDGFKCQSCDKKFSVMLALVQHTNYFKGKCNERRTLKENPYYAEQKTEDNKKIFQCKNCAKVLSTPCGIRYHLLSAHSIDVRKGRNEAEGNKFKCVHCGQSFKHKISIERHQTKEQENSGKISCELCNAEFEFKACVKVSIKTTVKLLQ